ncbi:mannose-6-phosphate isomerase [Sphingopyxis sp. OAS728]|uniref:class I mannose-6-phosphate isomerase n=1 Tax=Sphingopyxis sp. OAS728 TaxID=2663823 RepID=UPI00178A4F12|nr:class I mannose-6-phosphate isomerase [Sphingopyxis sp. OAS728]MBE1529475.1 mannose-6-phosphate isomerase [Sphingopyxis sp. OAS728]
MENAAHGTVGRSAVLRSEKLDTMTVDKPWGVTRLPPPFAAAADRRVGEIWFRPPEGSPLLVKYIFTSERLSIQVHPGDEQAKARGLASGKEECWYILDAEPGAVLGIGTRARLGEAELADAARSGAIEDLMEWHPVEAGMFFYIPAGTVHAIGAGVSLVEIQQNADITYRLYDYGRPRELHLADGTAVASAAPMPADLERRVEPDVSALLLDSDHLGVAYFAAGDLSLLGEVPGDAMIVPLRGDVTVGGVSARAGECIWTEAAGSLEASSDARFLVGWHKV